jgi:hypothetical protein
MYSLKRPLFQWQGFEEIRMKSLATLKAFLLNFDLFRSFADFIHLQTEHSTIDEQMIALPLNNEKSAAKRSSKQQRVKLVKQMDCHKLSVVKTEHDAN